MEKDLNYYMSLPYEEKIIPSPEGGFVGTVPDLPGCITQAETKIELLDMIEDAKKCWLQAALETGEDIDEPVSDENYSGRFNLRIPKSLHRKLSESAKADGVSLNQMAMYLIASGLGTKIENK